MKESLPRERTLTGAIAYAAGVISSDHFPTGERASLRRMAPGQDPPLGFYRFALDHLPAGWEQQEPDWMALVAGMALMSPNAHRRERGFGRAMADAGFSEARLERLLAADGDTQRVLLLRAARFLAAKATPFDWTQAALLLLTRDEQKRRDLYRRIAGDYYRHLRRE